MIIIPWEEAEQVNDTAEKANNQDNKDEDGGEQKSFVEVWDSLMFLVICLNLPAYVSESIRVVSSRNTGLCGHWPSSGVHSLAGTDQALLISY